MLEPALDISGEQIVQEDGQRRVAARPALSLFRRLARPKGQTRVQSASADGDVRLDDVDLAPRSCAHAPSVISRFRRAAAGTNTFTPDAKTRSPEPAISVSRMTFRRAAEPFGLPG
jgi:hypothetical protein